MLLFCNSVYSAEVRLVGVYQKISSLPAKMVTYSKKFCCSSMIIGHYYHPPVFFNVFICEAFHGECDVTQFIQLNLDSSFFQ